jgi:chromosome segregation ATPase
LKDEVERLSLVAMREKPKSFDITYSEEEMNALQERINGKQVEINQLRSQEHERNFYLETLESKMHMQENLIRQLEAQLEEEASRNQQEIQEYIKRERNYREQLSEMQVSHQQTFQTYAGTQGQGIDYNQPPVQNYLNEIDRLNGIVQQLQYEVEEFKLKLSSMVNQETRL